MAAHALRMNRPILDEMQAIYWLVVFWWLAVRGIEPENCEQLAAVGCVMGRRSNQANAAIPLFPAQRDHVVHYGIA